MKLVDGWWIPDRAVGQKNGPLQQAHKDLAVISFAMNYVRGRECAIQAGARIGMWPTSLASLFRQVVCFEPALENFHCAQKNLEDLPGVALYNAALGETTAQREVELAKSDGLHQVVESGGAHQVDVVTIDSLKLAPNVIFLDIEGYEYYALQGARETLKEFKPTLVLEDNKMRSRYGIKPEAIEELIGKTYKIAAKYNYDTIWVPR